jgi:hypothetical protein
LPALFCAASSSGSRSHHDADCSKYKPTLNKSSPAPRSLAFGAKSQILAGLVGLTYVSRFESCPKLLKLSRSPSCFHHQQQQHQIPQLLHFWHLLAEEKDFTSPAVFHCRKNPLCLGGHCWPRFPTWYACLTCDRGLRTKDHCRPKELLSTPINTIPWLFLLLAGPTHFSCSCCTLTTPTDITFSLTASPCTLHIYHDALHVSGVDSSLRKLLFRYLCPIFSLRFF